MLIQIRTRLFRKYGFGPDYFAYTDPDPTILQIRIRTRLSCKHGSGPDYFANTDSLPNISRLDEGGGLRGLLQIEDDLSLREIILNKEIIFYFVNTKIDVVVTL